MVQTFDPVSYELVSSGVHGTAEIQIIPPCRPWPRLLPILDEGQREGWKQLAVSENGVCRPNSYPIGGFKHQTMGM